MKIPEKADLWVQTYRKLNDDALYDYLRETFKEKLSTDFLDKVDIVDFLINYLNNLDRQKEHYKILKLIDMIYKYNYNSFKKGDYQYIDSYILDIKLFKDEITLNDFANLTAAPVESIDKLIEFHKKLVYYGHHELAYKIAARVYTPVEESLDLIVGAEKDFAFAVYLYKWQEHYDKIKTGEEANREELISYLEEYNFSLDKYYDNIYNYLTGEDNLSKDFNQEFVEDQRVFIEKIN